MKNFLKYISNKDYGAFTVYNAELNEKDGTIAITFEPFEEAVIFDKKDHLLKNPIYRKNYIERINQDDEPVLHTLTFKDLYCIDYLVDGKQDDLAYENFCDALFNFAYRNYMNNILGPIDDSNEVIFKNIIEFFGCQDENYKTKKYGSCITFKSMTSLWLDILKENNVKIDYKELDRQLEPKINEMMQRYLIEHPEYIERIETVNKNLNNLMSKTSSENKNQAQPNQ